MKERKKVRFRERKRKLWKKNNELLKEILKGTKNREWKHIIKGKFKNHENFKKLKKKQNNEGNIKI